MACFHEKSTEDVKQIIEFDMSVFSEKTKNVATCVNNVLAALNSVEEIKRKLEHELETYSVDESPNKKRIIQKLDKKMKSCVKIFEH